MVNNIFDADGLKLSLQLPLQIFLASGKNIICFKSGSSITSSW